VSCKYVKEFKKKHQDKDELNKGKSVLVLLKGMMFRKNKEVYKLDKE